jgi:hypothetical protein
MSGTGIRSPIRSVGAAPVAHVRSEEQSLSAGGPAVLRQTTIPNWLRLSYLNSQERRRARAGRASPTQSPVAGAPAAPRSGAALD